MDDYLRFCCPACGKRLKATRECIGRHARCRCGQRVLIPAPVAVAPEEPTARPLYAQPAASAVPPRFATATGRQAPAPLRTPPALPPVPEPGVRPFSAGLMMFLGLITCNVFAILRLLWLHGQFPRRRPNDPTAAQALVGAFIPFYSLYWGPFALGRLVTRLNEQRREWGLPELPLHGLLAALVVCMLGPGLVLVALRPLLLLMIDNAEIAQVLFFAMPLLNWFLIVPLFATAVQNGANALAEAAGNRQAGSLAAFLVRTELKWRARQRITWGIYLTVVAFLHMTVVGLVLTLQSKSGDEGYAVVMNFLVISLPLLTGAAALFARAAIMSARRARLEQEVAPAEAVVAAERLTTRVYQLAWSGVFALVGLVFFGVLVAREILPGRVTSFRVADDILPPVLLIVLPAWVIALHLVARAMQGTGGSDEIATAPIVGLQARPIPWWPAGAGAGLLVLLLVVTAAWQHYERRSDQFLVSTVSYASTQSRPRESTRPPEPAGQEESPKSQPAPRQEREPKPKTGSQVAAPLLSGITIRSAKTDPVVIEFAIELDVVQGTTPFEKKAGLWFCFGTPKTIPSLRAELDKALKKDDNQFFLNMTGPGFVAAGCSEIKQDSGRPGVWIGTIDLGKANINSGQIEIPSAFGSSYYDITEMPISWVYYDGTRRLSNELKAIIDLKAGKVVKILESVRKE